MPVTPHFQPPNPAIPTGDPSAQPPITINIASRPLPKTSTDLASAIKRLGEISMARKSDLDPVVRGRMVAMLAFLRYYTTLSLDLNWTQVSELAALGAGRGKTLARRLREWCMAYLHDPDFLPRLGCFNLKKALVEDEAICQEIQLHLLGVGKYFTTQDIVEYSARPEVMAAWGTSRPISDSTARRWLKKMDYRYTNEKKGLCGRTRAR